MAVAFGGAESPSGDSALPKATTNYPRRAGVLTKPCKRPRPAEGEKKIMPSFLPAIPPAHFIRHLPLHKGGFRRQATTNPAPKFFYYFFHRKAVPPLFAGDAKEKRRPRHGTGSVFSGQLGRGSMLLSARGTSEFTRKAKAGPLAPAPFWRIWGCGWCS